MRLRDSYLSYGLFLDCFKNSITLLKDIFKVFPFSDVTVALTLQTFGFSPSPLMKVDNKKLDLKLLEDFAISKGAIITQTKPEVQFMDCSEVIKSAKKSSNFLRIAYENRFGNFIYRTINEIDELTSEIEENGDNIMRTYLEGNYQTKKDKRYFRIDIINFAWEI